MISLAVQALLVAYLPGALLYRTPGRSQAFRATLSFEERGFWALILSVFWSVGLVLALGAAGRYSFDRLLAANLALSLFLALLWRRRLAYAEPAPGPTGRAAIPVGLIVLGLWLYFPPSEYIIGGKDPGTYLNEGIQIAQRGSLVIHDPVVATVPVPLRDLFFPSHYQPWYYSTRFMGFFIQAPSTGDVIGQFPHLFPASIAVGYGLNGLSGARQAVGAWAILGLLAIYFAARRLVSPPAAAGAAVLTAVNVATVWFARYPNSEVVMQAGLFSALLAFAYARQTKGIFFSLLAGSLMGAMLFLRYEIVLAFLGVGAAVLLIPAVGQRVSWAFTAALILIGGAGYYYLQGPMRAYSYYPLGFTRDHGMQALAMIAVALLTLRVVLRKPAGRNFVRVALPWILATALVLLAAYAYFLRQPGGKLALGDAIAFRSFSWYVGPWVLGLGTAGFAYLIVSRFWQAPALILTFMTFSAFFFYKTRIIPEHFWSARRFLVMTLPGAMIGVGGAADAIATAVVGWIRRAFRAGPNAFVGEIAAGVLCAALIVPVALAFWQVSGPVSRHVEYASVIPHLETLAAHFGPRDLVIVESRDAGSDLHALAEPLAYIYAKNVLVLNSAAPVKLLMEQFVTWARTQYADVYFLGGGGTDLLTARLSAIPIASDRFQVPEYESRLNALPSGVRQKEFEFGVYRLALSSEPHYGPVHLTIGGEDDLNVVRFHAREHSADGTPFRWTQAQSFIVFPGLSPEATTLTIWMGHGGRPTSVDVPRVEVFVDDVVIGTATPTDTVQAYSFPLPASRPSSTDPLRIRLRVPTWNPRATLGVPDSRDLGVQITRVDAE